MRKLLLVLSISLANFITSSAQENNPLISSGEIIDQAVKLHDDGNYKDAIKLYKKVNRNDTNYVRALYELALTCMADSQFNEGIAVCELAMAEPTDRERLPDILTQYGSLLDNAGKQDRAIHIFDSAIQIYPA